MRASGLPGLAGGVDRDRAVPIRQIEDLAEGGAVEGVEARADGHVHGGAVAAPLDGRDAEQRLALGVGRQDVLEGGLVQAPPAPGLRVGAELRLRLGHRLFQAAEKDGVAAGLRIAPEPGGLRLPEEVDRQDLVGDGGDPLLGHARLEDGGDELRGPDLIEGGRRRIPVQGAVPAREPLDPGAQVRAGPFRRPQQA